MRYVPLLIAVLAILGASAVPAASAHGGEDHSGDPLVDHTQLLEGSIPPGDSIPVQASFGGEVLDAGWVMFISAKVAGETGDVAQVYLGYDDAEVETWDFPVAEEVATVAVRLPVTSLYVLEIIAPAGNHAVVSFTIQFDQTCECLGKSVLFPGSLIVFQVQAVPDQHIALNVSSVGDDFTYRGWSATTGEPVSWPTSFTTISEGAPAGSPTRLEVDTTTSETYYFFFKAITGSGFILPVMTIEEHGGPGWTPLPAWMPVVAMACGALVLGSVAVWRPKEG